MWLDHRTTVDARTGVVSVSSVFQINEEASEKVLEVEQKYNEIRKPAYDRRNEVIKTIPDFWLTAVSNFVCNYPKKTIYLVLLSPSTAWKCLFSSEWRPPVLAVYESSCPQWTFDWRRPKGLTLSPFSFLKNRKHGSGYDTFSFSL